MNPARKTIIQSTGGATAVRPARSFDGASNAARNESFVQRLTQIPQNLQLAADSVAKGVRCIGQPGYRASGTTQSFVVHSAHAA